MTLFRQIGLGSLTLCLCITAHVGVLGGGIELIGLMGLSDAAENGGRQWIFLILISSGVILLGHSLQVWIWAAAFRAFGALHDLAEAIYFTLVTTTTLGYGDVTLKQEHRIFGAMSAVSGLMTYGLSTAFLVAVASDILTSATT